MTTDDYHRLFTAGLELSLLSENLREDRAAGSWYVYFALRGHKITPGKAIAFADRISHLALDSGLVALAVRDHAGPSGASLEDIRHETALLDTRIHMALLDLQRRGLLEIDDASSSPRYAIKAPFFNSDP